MMKKRMTRMRMSQDKGHLNSHKAYEKTKMRVSRKRKPKKHLSRPRSSRENTRHLLLLSKSPRKWLSLHPRSQPQELLQGPPLKRQKKRLLKGRNPLKRLKRSLEKEENL